MRFNSQEHSEDELDMQDDYHPVTSRIEKKTETPTSNTEWEIED